MGSLIERRRALVFAIATAVWTGPVASWARTLARAGSIGPGSISGHLLGSFPGLGLGIRGRPCFLVFRVISWPKCVRCAERIIE